MIPAIPAIVEMLRANECTAQQAIAWINAHIEDSDLRDQFAAAIITGLYASYGGNPPEPEQMAEDAYAIADAMLEARAK